MNTPDKKAISEALREAINREDISNRHAAKHLNINPCYVTMAMNPNAWDHMGKTVWQRLNDWHITREPLTSFQIPNDETIWQPKEKPAPDNNILVEPNIKIKKVAEKQNPDINIELDRVKKELTECKNDLFVIKADNIHLKNLIKVPALTPALLSAPINHKMSLDIEINLTINGQTVKL